MWKSRKRLTCCKTIFQLLEVNENRRLGNQGAASVKSHSWFDGVDWEGIRDKSVPVPHELMSRITQHSESHGENCPATIASPPHDEELNIPEWLDEW